MIVPDAGAGSSMSTLSVEISTTVSPFETWSPTLTAHCRIVPSVTDSPPVGVTMSTVLPGAASSAVSVAGWASVSAAWLSASAVAPLVAISASTAPTATVSPSCA